MVTPPSSTEKDARTCKSDEVTVKTISTLWVFAGATILQVLAALFVNRVVLTDEVYRAVWVEQGSVGQIDAALALARRWETFGYVLTPATLAVRIAASTLLVQLAVILLGSRPTFGIVFRAGTWAQASVILGIVAQGILFLSSAGSTPDLDQLRTPPGAASSLASGSDVLGPDLLLLLDRITVFDLAWIAFFALALETPGKISGRVAVVAVSVVWIAATLVQWVGWLYLTRLG